MLQEQQVLQELLPQREQPSKRCKEQQVHMLRKPLGKLVHKQEPVHSS